MTHPRDGIRPPAAPRLPARAACLCLLLTVGATALPGQKFEDDPVEQFRQALIGREKEGGSATTRLQGDALAYAVAFRKASLEKAAAALKSPDQLSRALLLIDWPRDSRTDAERDQDRLKGGRGENLTDFGLKSRDIESVVRKDMSDRFIKVVRDNLKGGNTARVVATAALVGETIEGTSELMEERLTLYADLAPLAQDLVALTDNPETRVQAAAASALGAFAKTTDVVCPVLKRLLARDRPAETRRAAAEALVQLVQRVSGFQPLKGSEPGIANRSQGVRYRFAPQVIFNVVADAVPAAAAGLADESVAVRRSLTRALYQGAQVMANVGRLYRYDAIEAPAPPRERKWSDAEKAAVAVLRQNIAREQRTLNPPLEAYRLQADAIAGIATDEDPQTRLEARRTLGELARVRGFLVDRRDSVPKRSDLDDDKDAKDPALVDVPDDPMGFYKNRKISAGEVAKYLTNDPLGDLLISVGTKVVGSGFRDPKPAARRAALEAAEMLGTTAERFIPRFVESLDDRDPFSRWIAARALGRLAPANAEVAVPGLTKLVDDPDLNARLAALNALAAFGPKAKGAVEALTARIEKGDYEGRLAAMKALEAVGKDAAPAIPALGRSLAATDARVRAEAARVLGRFGTDAASQTDALEKLTADPDIDVRKAASAALFAVSRP